MKQLVYKNVEFLHKLSEIASGKLICVLDVLTGVLICLHFGVKIDVSGQELTFDGHFFHVLPVLPWPVYSPDMSPIEPVWDALDRRIRQRVPVPTNIQQLRTAIEEEWDNIPQATINNLINSM
ncbi:hypothetical protein ANANG_G00028010 [Anguilla anguilla]|uniref:Tc1-like transposase DDE domain-containing protein n=1 Tax=Anguilla anguilla TaxID=7936 RepID=A0A9D3MRH6_ANGAN|nr:hypothetical protein ANANG_G00028010 [Anguilla anguilla]